ncbi:MAG: helix-turn-helix domain-containing protein [Spirochaetota bacterium]
MAEFTGLIGTLGTATALYTGLLLVLGRHRKTVRLLGGAFFFIFSAILLLFTGFLLDRYQSIPHLAFVHLPIVALAGPTIYLFLRFVAEPDFRLKRIYLVHLAPAVAVAIYMADIYALPAAAKQRMLALTEPLPEYVIPSLRLVFLAIYTLPLAYFLLSVRYLRPFFSRLKAHEFAFFRAMRIFLLVCAVATLLMIGTIVGGDWMHVKVLALSAYSVAVMLAFVALARNQHFPELLARDARRYDRLKGRSVSKLEQLERLLLEGRLYADESLRIADLAGRLGLRPDQLSQLINDNFGMNFNRYINRLRVDEAKRQLAASREPGVLRIAYECGFATKSAFNAAFKLETGLTPTEYMKAAKQAEKK